MVWAAGSWSIAGKCHGLDPTSNYSYRFGRTTYFMPLVSFYAWHEVRSSQISLFHCSQWLQRGRVLKQLPAVPAGNISNTKFSLSNHIEITKLEINLKLAVCKKMWLVINLVVSPTAVCCLPYGSPSFVFPELLCQYWVLELFFSEKNVKVTKWTALFCKCLAVAKNSTAHASL